MTRTQLYLPESQYEELKRLASTRNLTFAELAREIIEEKLNDIKRKKRAAERENKISAWLSSLKKIKKLKEKGIIRDGSIKHDKYLYGKSMKNI